MTKNRLLIKFTILRMIENKRDQNYCINYRCRESTGVRPLVDWGLGLSEEVIPP